MFDTLAYWDEDFEIKPFLAESIEPNGSFDEWTVTLREATGERGRIRSALGPKLVEIPAPVTELRLEAVELAEHTGQQLALVAPEGEDADLRLREGLRQVRASAGGTSRRCMLRSWRTSRRPRR